MSYSCMICGATLGPDNRCPRCAAVEAGDTVDAPPPAAAAPAATVAGPTEVEPADTIAATVEQRPPQQPQASATEVQPADTMAATVEQGAPRPLIPDGERRSVRDDASYQRGKVIGRGGMGEVVAVFDRELERDVVMKTVLPAAESKPAALHRFVEEAKVTGQLQHPNIVPVYDYGQTREGQLFFVMKRVEGQELKAVIKALAEKSPKARRDYPLPRRLDIFLQVCNGVAYAHDKGVTHRDLKPENIMLGAFGEVLVMDWGLAKVRGRQAPELAQPGDVTTTDTEDIELTQQGQMLGTPMYMSPEQARGEIDRVDHRSDIYALGTILHELLVLRRAFTARSLHALIDLVVNNIYTPPGEDRRDPPVPRELAAVVKKALSPNPDDRYQSVGELAGDVRRYLDGELLESIEYTASQRFMLWIRRNRATLVITAIAGAAIIFGAKASRQLQLKEQRDKAMAAYQEGGEHLAAGRWSEAQAAGLRALALDLDGPPVRELISRAGAQLAIAQARLKGQARAAELADPLSRAIEQAKALGDDPTAADASGWYRRHSAVLSLAREIARASEGRSGRQQRVEAALSLARRLSSDGNLALAELMLDEAAEEGLAPEAVDRERWLARRAAAAQGRQAIIRADAVLGQVAKGTLPASEAREALLLLRPDPLLVARMIRVVTDKGQPWEARELVVEWLGRAGDRQTRSQVPPASIGGIHHRGCRQTALAPIFQHLHERFLTRMKEDPTLDTGEALSLVMLIEPHGLKEIALAMARLGDPRCKPILALKRLAWKPHSAFWVQAAPLLERLEDPEQIPFCDGYQADLLRAWMIEARDSKAALPHYERALDSAPFEVARSLRPFHERCQVAAGADAASQVRAWLGTAEALLRALRGRGGGHRRKNATLARTCALYACQALRRLGKPKEALAAADLAVEAEEEKNPGKENMALGEIADEVYLERADLLLEAGRYDDALKAVARGSVFKQGITQDMLRARLLRAKGDLQGAMRQADKAIAREPSWIPALWLRSQLHAESGDQTSAIRDGLAVLRLQPRHPVAAVRMATMLSESERHQEAIEIARAHHERSPEDAGALELYARVLLRAYRFEAVLTAISGRYGQADPPPALRRIRGLARALDGQAASAYADLTAVAQTYPDDPTIKAMLGRCLAIIRKYDEARQLLGAAIEAHPDHAELRFRLGLIAMETGDAAAMIAQMRAGCEAQARAKSWSPSENVSREHLMTMLTQRAIAAANAGQLDAAERDLLLALDVGKDLSARRASVLRVLEQVRQAKAGGK